MYQTESEMIVCEHESAQTDQNDFSHHKLKNMSLFLLEQCRQNIISEEYKCVKTKVE